MTTPADNLRAAAALLREAAGHSTPGPWRTHDTHLDSPGGHTATVLTDRENINDTELIAWLPTMSHEPWDETRNAWRNAGWMALMDPSVGLALADWLDAAAEYYTPGPTHPTHVVHALAVARQVLGTPTTDMAPCRCPHPADEHSVYGCADNCGCEWMPPASVPAAPADRGAGPETLSALMATIQELRALQQPLVDGLRFIWEDMDRVHKGGDEWATEWMAQVWMELPLQVRAAGGDSDAAQELADEAQPTETKAAPQCTAGLLPATDAAVDRCIRRGKHDSHKTASGALWGDGSADEAQQPATAATEDPQPSPTALLLASTCTACPHPLGSHQHYRQCLADGCTCTRYRPDAP